MHKGIARLLIVSLFVWPLSQACIADASVDRRMAVTFDDLPIATSVHKSTDARRRITEKIVHALTERDIPAIGFVNEQQLFSDGQLVDAELHLLGQWLDAGLDLRAIQSNR